jgi:mannose-1-phosphate guanylyltransferase
MFITPADHLITDEDAFEATIRKGLAKTEESDFFVTIGIQPHKPETGYGYIQYNEAAGDDHGSFAVKAFTEKPDLEHAKKFLESGDFLWNAGMFIWNIDALSSGLDIHLPELMATLGETWNDLETAYEKASIERIYGECDNISIDYGLMERADQVCVIPTEMGWSDLGNWGAIYDLGAKDTAENVVVGAHVLLQNCTSCLVVNATKDKALVLTDLNNKIVVQTESTTLTFPQGNDQAIKQIVKAVKIELGEAFV